jgi:hypothetical protein
MSALECPVCGERLLVTLDEILNDMCDQCTSFIDPEAGPEQDFDELSFFAHSM